MFRSAEGGEEGQARVVGAEHGPDPIGASVRFYVPQMIPDGLVTAIYAVEIRGPHDTEIDDLLHPEWGNLRMRIGRDWDVAGPNGVLARCPPRTLFGPTSRARRVRARVGTVMGIGFTPQGWYRLVRQRASRLADVYVDADSLLPGIAALHQTLDDLGSEALRMEAIDRFLSTRLTEAPNADHRIDLVLKCLTDCEVQTVEELSIAVSMAPVQLARNCRRWFGFPPKLLLRRQRFLRTLALLMVPDGPPIAALIDRAYADQSHFNREFKRFIGTTPRRYLAGPRSILMPAAEARERELGALLQGLHRT